jgi:hypothetical protein
MSVKSYLLGSSVTALGLFAGLAAAVAPAHAAVVCAITGTTGTPDLACSSEDGDESKLFEIKARGVTTFFNSIGSNTSVQDVQTVTNVPVDTSNGYGEVKPSTKGDSWTATAFMPTSTSQFAWDGLFVRGQIISAPKSKYDGNLFATVTDVNGSTTTFEWTGIKANADFGTLGFDEPKGDNGIAIASAMFSLDSTGIFKSMKQFDVSNCLATSGCIGGGGQPPAIPEPSTWGMMILGFAGLGFAAYRRTRAKPVFAA